MKFKSLFLYIIIFFAGFSFLIYEVAWNRYLSLILGTTVTASTVVLSAFMAGFGIGAYLLGNRANNSRNPIKILSYLLFGIAFLSFSDFLFIGRLSSFLYVSNINSGSADLIVFISVFLLLVLPAFLMGGVIPLVGKIIIEDINPADKIGKIYAFETLGSAMGGLFTGFIFLRTLGQYDTFILASIINIVLALILFFYSKSKAIGLYSPSEKKIPTLKSNSNKSPKIATFSTFVIGLSLLSLQIIWIRIFKTYFTNTSYTFSLIAAFVILGYSLGSYIFKRRISFIISTDRSMLRLILMMIGFILVGLVLLNKLPELLMFPFKESAENALIRIFLIPTMTSILVVLPPAILSGYAFPLAYAMFQGNEKNISKNIGYIMMMNILGALIGPVFAAFILIPYIGSGKSMIFIAFLLSILSVYISLLIQSDKKNFFNKNVLIAQTVLLLLLMIFIKHIHFYPPSVKSSECKILVHDETSKGTVTVINEIQKGMFGNSTFVNNSSVIGSNYDAIKAVKLVGHIPFFSGLKCENVLIIGFGVGVTTSAIASHSEVKRIDCVELVPSLIESARYYKEFNNAVYRDKRLNIISGDGRHFLQMTQNKYDLISCDPTHPVLGSGNLYTQEYFMQCRQHLNPNGMVSQYLPLHKLRLNDLLGIIKTFHSVFPNSSVWLGQYHAILLGTNGDHKIDFEVWRRNIEKMPPDRFLYLQAYHIASNLVMDSKKINDFPENIEINTDDLSYTEFFSIDCFNSENLYENLKYLSGNRCPVNEVFTNIEDTLLMNKYIQGNKKMTESLYFSLKGDQKNAIKSLREACILNPEDQEYPFLIKFYFGLEK